MVSDSSFLHTTSNLETSGDLYILKNSPPQQGPGWHLRSQAHQQGIVGAHICRGLPHGAPSLSLSPLPWPPMKGRCFCPISQRSSVRLWGTRICHPASEHKQRLSHPQPQASVLTTAPDCQVSACIPLLGFLMVSWSGKACKGSLQVLCLVSDRLNK